MRVIASAPRIVLAAALLAACTDGEPVEPHVSAHTMGVLRLITTTTGGDVDADGYDVMIPSIGSRHVGANDTLEVGLRPGVHVISVSGVAANCKLALERLEATIDVGEMVEVVLAGTCRSLGTVTVTVETTGVAPDPDGYIMSAVAPGFRIDTATAIQGTYRVRVIEGGHSVTLGNVAANCDVVGPNPVDVEVASGGSAAASFSVECGPLTRLAYVRHSRAIHTIASNATDEFRLSRGVTSDQNPAWSPDGRRIAFSSSVGGMRDIWVMDADGSNRMQLTHHAARDYKPTWSPDGRRIAFVSERDGNAELYIVDADGSRETRLTTHEATDIDPSWSPDGLRIAFSSNRDGSPAIYVINATGTQTTRLTTHPHGDFSPAWSPSGDLIAFQRFERHCEDPVACPSSIRVISAAGSLATYVTAGRQPAWSPDGRKIAYASYDCYVASYLDDVYGCANTGIRIIGLDGRGDVAIVNLPAIMPAWRW